MAPYATNIMFVLYECTNFSSDVSYVVKLLHNEKELYFPGCNESLYCPLETLQNLYATQLNYNFTEMCFGPFGSPSVRTNVATTTTRPTSSPKAPAQVDVSDVTYTFPFYFHVPFSIVAAVVFLLLVICLAICALPANRRVNRMVQQYQIRKRYPAEENVTPAYTEIQTS